MTPMSIPQEQLAQERRSALLIASLVLLALILGWQVKTAVQNANRSIEHSGFTSQVPSGWLVQDGAGDLLFVARNPLALDQLYRLSQLPAEADLALQADSRNLTRGRLDKTYRVLTAEPIVFGGRDGYKVTFARVDLDSPGMPHIIEGLEYYFAQGDQVIVLSLESQSDTFDDALPNFQNFVQSVIQNQGE